MTDFGARLRELREAAGLTQKGLAEAAGVSQPAVGHWETGQRSPGLTEALKLAAALGVQVEHLLAAPTVPPAAPRGRGRPRKPLAEAAPPHAPVPPEWEYVPLLGYVGAGPGVDDPLPDAARARVPARWVRGTTVAFVVRGESMADEGIHSGDTVVVRTDPLPQPGDVVVAWVESKVGGGCVLKKLRRDTFGRDVLGSGRTAHVVTGTDRVFGVYVGTVGRDGASSGPGQP